MNNSDLDKLLKSAPVPERAPDYWAEFPKRVTRRLAWVRSRGDSRPAPARWRLLAWSFGLAAACIAAGFFFGTRQERVASESRQLAALQTIYREVADLFPNQLQAIIIDEQGPRLVLSDTTNVPSSDPLFVKICQAKRCQTFITFSGQQIRVNGEVFDVLADGGGGVILAGRKAVWTSAQSPAGQMPWDIEARPLRL